VPDDLYERMKKWEAEQAALKAARKKTARKSRGLDISKKLKDENLRLAVIDALVDAGALDLDFDDFEAKDEDALDPKVRRKILSTPLDAALLASLEKLAWEGGHDVQFAIWPQWDGEDDTFDVRAFDGLDLLTGCHTLTFIACESVDDLRPLLGMRALKKLRLPKRKRSDAAKNVLAALTKRGVKVVGA
jgi:hypothetical protein